MEEKRRIFFKVENTWFEDINLSSMASTIGDIWRHDDYVSAFEHADIVFMEQEIELLIYILDGW